MAFYRIRNFVFTLNNPTENETAFWANMLADDGLMRTRTRTRYLVLQTERGANGTEHLQGYVEMRNARSLATIRRTYTPAADANALPRLHIERRRGTQAQAIAYSKKTDTRIEGIQGEGGTAKKLGALSLATVAELIKNGEDLQELSDDYAPQFIKHGSSIRGWALNRRGKRNWAPEIIIYYGKTDTGKSSLVNKTWKDAYWVPEPERGGWWWPNYMGEETIVIDDFRGQYCKYTTLLKLLDRYPYTIQEKGSNSNFISKRIVITTNVHPLQWYDRPYRDKQPLRRRFRDFATLYTFDDNSTFEEVIKVQELPGWADEDETR